MQEPQTGEIAEQFAFFGKQRRAAIAEKCSLIAFMAVMRDRRRIPGQPIQFMQCLFHRIRIQVEWGRISESFRRTQRLRALSMPRGAS
ncbi:hypothetical protein [Burkholderia cenocepacia]|uniref:hypothetical protein n=1 Tax=Burkholderia cenocepacia TaxID=95486 RepID=UPI001E44393C|nr:hypothetical protein [Burkholderia cenocepacia]